MRQRRVLIEEWLPTAGDWRVVHSGTVNRTSATRQEAFVWTGRTGPFDVVLNWIEQLKQKVPAGKK